MQRADVAVYGPDGTLRLVVEVKRKIDASAQWISELRQDLYQFEAIPRAPYFLLALPDYLHLWKEGPANREASPPDYSVETASILAPYLGNPPLALGEISAFGLEMLISSWLTELVNGYPPPDLSALSQPWLLDSGLYEAIKHGKVAVGAMA